ncbi:copper amine oxidase N-terminal domain-containing protein [Paenibacillus sp. 1P07SE]|uniref:copper amine oxidase N-terminal domain-containing protein n=1 Tax=Paenibacillus sp. 1P07SE TaxID=3132209 RepID=UPI0039A654D7
MKKSVFLAGLISLSLMASTAFAAPEIQGKNEPPPVEVEAEGTTESNSVKEDEKNNGSKGLQNAYENVKDKPAGVRIAELLKTKYNIDVNADTNLATLATTLEKEGELEAAAEVQAEVVSQDPANIEEYKKLSKIKIKLGDKKVKVYVNGKALGTEVSPVIESGRTLVPFRAISESLDAVVTYDNVSKTVIVTRDGVVVTLTLGSNIATINGKTVTLDVAGKVKNNRVFVPLRFLSEALNTNVTWDTDTTSAIIIDKNTEA